MYIVKSTVHHVISYDMMDPNVATRIKQFNKALKNQLDYTNFIIEEFEGFGNQDLVYDLLQWDAWDTAYDVYKTILMENENIKIIQKEGIDINNIAVKT